MRTNDEKDFELLEEKINTLIALRLIFIGYRCLYKLVRKEIILNEEV